MTANRDASWWLLPEGVRNVADVIGRTSALKLAGALLPPEGQRRPGKSGRFGLAYCPQSPEGASFDRLAGIVGDEAARALVQAFGGSELRFSSCRRFTDRTRDASVRDHWRNRTLSARWIAWLHDITERQVRNICRGEPRLVLRQAQAAAREAA